MESYNPRNRNGNLRRKNRARFKAMDAPCGICQGRLGPIHYDEPSDAAPAEDWDNLQAAHYICNQKKGAKISTDKHYVRSIVNVSDGKWF